MPKLFNEVRTIFSVNSAETTGYLHAKKKKKERKKERKKIRTLPLIITKT